MAFRVVRYQHQSHTQEEGDQDRSTLLFDPRLERGVERVIRDRYRRLDAVARKNDLIVVRGSRTDSLERFEADTMLQRLVGETPVTVRAPKSSGTTPSFQTVTWSSPADALP